MLPTFSGPKRYNLILLNYSYITELNGISISEACLITLFVVNQIMSDHLYYNGSNISDGLP